VGNDAFPHLYNVSPYRRKVDFDYGRYDYVASIKLCKVPWPSDYRHVVNWLSAEARDAYLNGIDGPTIELASGFTHVQTDSVMVPVPYDVALLYNYVMLVVPPLTQDDRIDYETDEGVRTICAFIQSCTYHSPSTTELTLQVDQWTTYLPHLAAAPTLMLHRGHAPAYAVDIDAYLDNPREHCMNLLTPDVSFGSADVAASSTLLPIGAGEKMLILASTIPANLIEGLTEATVVEGSSTPATFYDTSARNGHQVGVNGYSWHYGGHEYASMRNPSAYTGSGASVPTYLTLYAIPTAQASAALAAWASRLPQFIQSIHAAYILPRDVLTLSGKTRTVADMSVYVVQPSTAITDVADLNLTKQMFGYPTRYSDIAKLYTSPYARLVVSDTLGHDVEVRIEDMGGSAKVAQQLSTVAECLRWDLIITGVGSAGTNRYTWKNLNGTNIAKSLPGSDVARYTIELGIPTYALYLDGRIDAQSRGYYNALNNRAHAVNAYQSTMRSANTGKANADASADTGKSNADASADTNVTNTANTGSNSTANTVIANNLRTSSTTRNNTASSSLTAEANQHLFNTLYADDEYTMSASDINLKSEAMSGALTTVGNIVSGNAFGAVSSGMSSIVNITTSQSLSALSSQNIEDKEAIGQGHQTNINAINIANASDQTTYQNTAATSTTANNVATANTNASNSAATAKANAARSQNTAKSNAGYDRSTTEENAKAALELARQDYMRSGHAHDLDNPASYGIVSGDASPDALMRRVAQVRIDTQSAGAIARAGDAMLRYGYTYDGLWIVAEWCPQGHDGCYWEASDVSVSEIAFANPTAERAFEDILIAGTTVWNDPDKIGGVPW
jgi:hypothetical protein